MTASTLFRLKHKAFLERLKMEVKDTFSEINHDGNKKPKFSVLVDCNQDVANLVLFSSFNSYVKFSFLFTVNLRK